MIVSLPRSAGEASLCSIVNVVCGKYDKWKEDLSNIVIK